MIFRIYKMKFTSALILLLAFSLTGCFRGSPSELTPIHLNPNMDAQPKYKPHGESTFFENGSTMRTPVEGTVARGELREDAAYYTGKDSNGNFLKKLPVAITKDLVERGSNRFEIYCTPCHSRIGDGKGIINEYGFVPPPSTLHDDRLRNVEDGHLYDVITNGIRNMQPYKNQVPVADRWAIVSYIRALQRSQYSKLSDVPENERK